MNSRFASLKEWGLAGVALIGAGLVTERVPVLAIRGGLDSPARMDLRVSRSALDGIKKLAGGLAWVGVYGDWRRRDVGSMMRGMEWTVRLDPDTMVYWLDSARIIAYDVKTWREDRGSEEEPSSVKYEQLHRAIAWLDQGRAIHPREVQLPIEQAVMWWSVARDAERAEKAWAAAQACKNVPHFVARVRAEMLVELGRSQEALAVLEAELPRLAADDPSAMKAVVRQRIAELSGQAGP